MTLLRLLGAIAAGALAAVITTIVIAITDLYLTGQGHAGLIQEQLTFPPLDIHLSIGDILVLTAAFLNAAFVWWITGKPGRQ